MSDKQTRKQRTPWIAIAVLVVAYVGSYFAVSDYFAVHSASATVSFGPYGMRDFKQEWMVKFYRPIGYIEAKIRGEPVIAISKSVHLEDWK